MLQSHKNLLMILKSEQKYIDAISDANSGISIQLSDSQSNDDIHIHNALQPIDE
jgi:hypothetical protein